MAGPIHPFGSNGRASAHPLLYVLLVLVVANLAGTALLYQRMSAAPQAAAGVETPLPEYMTRSALSDLAAQVQSDFNARNWTAFYDRFDPVAQVQFSRGQLEDQFERLGPLLGRIDRAEFSHHRFLGKQEPGNAFELSYVLQVSGGTFGAGVMTVTFIDRGDHPGIFSVYINGKG